MTDEVVLDVEPGWRISKVVGSMTGNVYYRIVCCACDYLHLQSVWREKLELNPSISCNGCGLPIPDRLVGYIQLCASNIGVGS